MMIARPTPGATRRIVCLPCAGGSASAYAGWQALAPPDTQICALELPGRGARFKEAPFTTMEAIVDHAERSCADYRDLPWVLFGHSMGAVAGLELARRLAGRAPGLRALVVSGCRAPHLPSRRPRRLFDLPADELRHELTLLDGLPPVFAQYPGLFDVFLPTIRADLRCREEWIAGRQALDIPIVALGGNADHSVTADDLSAWQRHSLHPLVVRLLDGGHFYLRDHASTLLAHLTSLFGVDGMSQVDAAQPTLPGVVLER